VYLDIRISDDINSKTKTQLKKTIIWLTIKSLESYSVISVKKETVEPTKFSDVKLGLFGNSYSRKKF